MELEEKEKQIDLLEYWQTIVKRKWVIIAFTTILVLIVGVLSFTTTPLYRARATVLIGQQSSEMLNIQEMFYNFPYQRNDFMNQYFNTQLRILTSRSLGERVAKKMNLAVRPEFQAASRPKKNPVQSVKNFLSFRWFFRLIAPEKKAKSPTSEPIYRPDPDSWLAFAVLGGLSVSPIKDTRIVELSYTSSHPVLAADMVNTVAEEFISYSTEMRYEITQQASEFLNEQIAVLREDLALKERELQRYGQEKELFFLNDKESTVLNKFADLNSAYTQAQIERIHAESDYRELRGLSVDSLPQSVSSNLIQNLKTQYTNMKNEYEEKRKVFKQDYPEMIKLRAKLDSMKDELRNEIQKAVNAAETEYRSALKKEASLKNLLNAQRKDVVRMNSNSILYNSLKIEVENKRKLLNSLVAKQNETLVSAGLGGLKTGNIKILDKALVPGAPFAPNTKKNIILALLVGLFGGVGLVFFLEYLDNSVKGPDEVEKLTGLPSLGVIPYLSSDGLNRKKRYGYHSGYDYSYGNSKNGEMLQRIKGIELVNDFYPQFFISEDYRTARTSILFSHAGSPPKIIAFTSSLSQEGKTATAANMAVAFSQLDEKVLIIDADLRKPRLHKIFKVRNVVGLSSYLTGTVSLEAAIEKTALENIWIIPSGPLPPNPTELLNSERMKELTEEARKDFDYILFDTPPVLAVVDPVIVGSFSESTVLVVQPGKTARKAFLKAVEELKRANTKIIGIVYNEAKVRERGNYAYSYRQYYRERYYSSKDQ